MISLNWPVKPAAIKAPQYLLNDLKSSYSSEKLKEFQQALTKLNDSLEINATFIEKDPETNSMRFTQPLTPVQRYWITCLVASFSIFLIAYLFHFVQFVRYYKNNSRVAKEIDLQMSKNVAVVSLLNNVIDSMDNSAKS